GGDDHLVAVLLEDPGQGADQRLVVVGDEDPGRGVVGHLLSPQETRDRRCRRSPRAPWGRRGGWRRSALRPWSQRPTVPPPAGTVATENVPPRAARRLPRARRPPPGRPPPSCPAISRPTVACPATMSGWSNGGTIASPSRAAIASARRWRSSEVRPASTTSPPHFFTPATFTAGAVSGITTTARTPTSCAA